MKLRLKKITYLSGYLLLTVLIVLSTILLVLFGNGYRFNLKTGEITGGGLIMLKSEPGDAGIYIDSEDTGRTPKRIPIKAGQYELKLVKAGYRDWVKNIDVERSEVTWVQYPLMVPDDLKTTELPLAEPVQAFTQSHNRRLLAMATIGTNAGVIVVESGKSEPRTVFNLPSDLLAQGAQIEQVSWAQDDDHLLARVRTPTEILYFTFSVSNNTDTHNLTREFSLPLDNLEFSFDNWQELYWLSPQGLRKLDLAGRTVSAILAENVHSFIVSPEALFLVQTKDAHQQITRLQDTTPKVLVENLPAAQYRLAYINFDGKRLLAINELGTKQVSIYSSTTDSGQELKPLPNTTATELLPSPDTRYLLMRDGNQFVTYDFEFSRIYRFSLDLPGLANLNWSDRYHLLGSAGGRTYMFEFDGGNLEPLVGQSGLAAFASNDQSLVYSIGSSIIDGRPVLQSTLLKP